jgi:transcriptional regulator with XRE-family HTH domain
MSVKTYPTNTPDLVRTLTDARVSSMGWQPQAGPATVLPMAEQDKQAGERLQALRERRGWSRETLAYHADVSTKTVERIEKGQVEGRRGTFRQLAEALEVDEYAIVGEPPGPQGVPLSGQLDGVTADFHKRVDMVEAQLNRIEQKLAVMRREREASTARIEALLKEQTDLLSRQTRLLESLQTAADHLPDGPSLQDRLAQELRDTLARTAPPEPQPPDRS